MTLRSFAIWALLSLIGLSTLIGLTAILAPSLTWWVSEGLVGTAFTLACYAMFLLLASVVIEHPKWHRPGIAAIAIGALALVPILCVAWGAGGRGTEEFFARTGVGLAFPAGTIVAIGLLFLRPLKGIGRAIRIATMVGMLFLAINVEMFAIIGERWFEVMFDLLDDDLVGRGFGSIILLTIAGGAVVTVLQVVDWRREPETESALGRRIQVDLRCPRCAKALTLPVGRRSCSSCGLEMRIEIEEPRCECGYLVYALETDTCPECGRTIPERLRSWARSGLAGREEPETAPAAPRPSAPSTSPGT